LFMKHAFLKFAALVAALFTGLAAAQYPTKPITLVVHCPRGPPDGSARIMARAMTKPIGTTFVVENRPSAGGILGPEVVAKAAPDGYTIPIHHYCIARTSALHPLR